MRVSVIGTGYVGLVSGVCFAELGNDVWCVDIDEKKIENLKKGIVPIYEPGLDTLIENSAKRGRIHFTTDLGEALKNTELCFIAVGTPMGEDGRANLSYVFQVAESIGKQMEHHMYVVDKSTVPVGTSEKVRSMIQAELDRRGSQLTFDVISNPEFLKEGSAIEDCLKPDRVIIGTDNSAAEQVMRELYEPHMDSENIIFMDIASAEMTKYAANSMLATKISFMNEMANICERVGADINLVRKGIGSDRRIGYHFISAGCGYGGSCFPKDVQALIKTGETYGYNAKILKAVEEVNAGQKLRIPQMITAKFGEDLTGRKFAVWGLAFKPNTDDMRDSPAITILKELTRRGATAKAYDPKAAEEAKNVYLKGNDRVAYVEDKYEALDDADALILVTEWKEFRTPDLGLLRKLLRQPVVFDGRNQYDEKQMKAEGFEYHQIGVGR